VNRAGRKTERPIPDKYVSLNWHLANMVQLTFSRPFQVSVNFLIVNILKNTVIYASNKSRIKR
jgi:hypothetical protein